jgi:hypothetical protein
MSREIRIKQKYLREENRAYGAALVEIPRERWIPAYGGDLIPARVFRSCDFLVQIFAEKDGARRISVNRTMIGDDGEWLQGISWDDLQRIKAECGFSDSWAVEVFPPTDELVHVANIRHLFVLAAAPLFAWARERTRKVTA